MPPVIPAPEEIAVKRGRPTLNYSIEELERIFSADEKTIYRWAGLGTIPSSKVGGKCIFPKASMNTYLRSKGLTVPGNNE